MDFLKLAKEYREQAIELLTKLVQINTVLDPSTITKEHPFGKGINDCLEYFLDVAKQDGFDTLNDEGYAGRITYKGTSDESIAVLGHLDVVPTGEGWTNPPFSATIIDNKMYGRGTMDDKGPVVASYIALKILKEQGIKLTKNVEFILGTDEETGWRGLEHFQKNYQLPDTGFSPDAEFPLINGEKGIMRMILKGKGAHDFILKGGSIFNAVIGKASLTLTKDLTNEFNKFLDNNNLTGNVEYIDGNYIYTVNGKTAHAMCPQEGVNAAADGFLSISDIAVTEDGKLVACNYVHCTFTASNTSYFYIWDDIASTPRVWFTSQKSANYNDAYMGYTMALKGTSLNAEVTIPAFNKTNTNARYSHLYVVDGTYSDANYKYSRDNAALHPN